MSGLLLVSCVGEASKRNVVSLRVNSIVSVRRTDDLAHNSISNDLSLGRTPQIGLVLQEGSHIAGIRALANKERVSLDRTCQHCFCESWACIAYTQGFLIR